MNRVINRPKGLLNQCNFFDFSKIKPVKPNKKALSEADDILNYAKQNGFIKGENNEYFDIQALIEDNEDLDLSFKEISEDGMICYDRKEKKYKIVINANHPQNRQRFTMTHEYIHYMFNRDFLESVNNHKDVILYRDTYKKEDIDVSATKYALEILMPEDKFRELNQNYHGNNEDMSKAFGVSPIALIHRANTLYIALKNNKEGVCND